METRNDLLHRIHQLEHRLGVVEDIEDIKRLQRMYGYYIDARLLEEMADLFATNGAIEISRRGRYVGRDNVRHFLREVLGGGRVGLNKDEFINHMQHQAVITVDADRQRAKGRWRALIQGSPPPGGKTIMWAEGVYENVYVKEDGHWKIELLWWVPTFYVSLPGYESVSFFSGPESETFPPQVTSVPPIAALGRGFVPYHYHHPITGKEVARHRGTRTGPCPVHRWW